MTVKTDFPYPIRELESVWIPMRDGCRLAARIWLPAPAETEPVPAILEYIPYRKNDFTALRDSIRHPYFAGHGYACVRVDMRGSGDSDGILYDEYLLQEQDDALEALQWIASQPWCTGAVGIIGKSWGGFNGLQIAARRPPELKAVISLCSTDDRYADDVHYMGGCLLASEMLSWASIMLAYNARPPDPRFVGERWREMWLERLEQTPPFIEAWLRHQRRDAFWQHGSVCENYGDITCPVYAVGGWADGYTNAVFRLLSGLPGPCKGLIGPWAHEYPEVAMPGPAIGFNQECLRWWDYWLKGIDTGIMAEPALRAWMQDSAPPQTHYPTRPGRWVVEETWPSPHLAPQRYWLHEGGQLAAQAPSQETTLEVQGSQSHGLAAGVWCAYGRPGDLAADQQGEDGLSLSFTSTPLAEAVEILGFPEVTLTLSANRPQALLAVRLCDVAPTGASTLITWGLLNLTHRESHARPSALEPGQVYTVSLRLNAVAHRLPVGHRWRVALSPTYWPHAWPSPEEVTLTFHLGRESYLTLPVRPPQDEAIAPFDPPEHAPFVAHEQLRVDARQRTVEHDLIENRWSLVDQLDGGLLRLEADGLTFGSTETNRYTIVEGDPLSAMVRCDRMIHLGRDAWQTRIESSSLMSADAEQFHVSNTLDAYEGHTRVFTKTWHCTVPRDLV